jgi:hypothetical protein
MSLTFRILLILAAVWAFRFVIIEIRKSKLQITDSLSWFFITLVFIYSKILFCLLILR